jgi:hypothetical protein
VAADEAPLIPCTATKSRSEPSRTIEDLNFQS